MPRDRIGFNRLMSLAGLIIGIIFLIIGFAVAVPNADKFGIF